MGTDLGKIKCYTLQSLKTTYIKLPENVTEIEYNVTYLSNIQKIEISSNIEKINAKAFVNSQELTAVIIHKGKNSISGSPWGNPYGERAIFWDEI